MRERGFIVCLGVVSVPSQPGDGLFRRGEDGVSGLVDRGEGGAAAGVDRGPLQGTQSSRGLLTVGVDSLRCGDHLLEPAAPFGGQCGAVERDRAGVSPVAEEAEECVSDERRNVVGSDDVVDCGDPVSLILLRGLVNVPFDCGFGSVGEVVRSLSVAQHMRLDRRVEGPVAGCHIGVHGLLRTDRLNPQQALQRSCHFAGTEIGDRRHQGPRRKLSLRWPFPRAGPGTAGQPRQAAMSAALMRLRRCVSGREPSARRSPAVTYCVWTRPRAGHRILWMGARSQ